MVRFISEGGVNLMIIHFFTGHNIIFLMSLAGFYFFFGGEAMILDLTKVTAKTKTSLSDNSQMRFFIQFPSFFRVVVRITGELC